MFKLGLQFIIDLSAVADIYDNNQKYVVMLFVYNTIIPYTQAINPLISRQRSYVTLR